MGIEIISLADTVGISTPEQVFNATAAVINNSQSRRSLYRNGKAMSLWMYYPFSIAMQKEHTSKFL